MHKIFFQTHGCSTNFSESEIMAGLLDKAGFEIIKKVDDAEIIVLNVCTVKGENTAVKEIRKIEEFGKKLVIAGCLTKELIREIRKITTDASLISTNNISKIVEVVEEVVQGNTIEAVADAEDNKLNLPRIRKNPVVGIIPILSGCNHECAYCSVKLVKGKLKSYPKEDIIKEVRLALRDRCKEIWVTSQDNASYGTEKIWRSSLPELLKEILELEQNFQVRIGMMNPDNMRAIIDDMIEIYKNKKVFKFLHLPLQSGSDEILGKMRRKYHVDDFKSMINKFKQEVPNLTFSTDLIVGFPGETVEQFNESLEIIKELRPDVLNISRFQPRPRTEAKYMKDNLQGNVIKDRSRILTDIFNNISRMNNEKWLDWKGEILIDEKGKDDSWIGRNSSYKQVIVKGDYHLGEIVKVKITNSTIYDLRAERA